MPERVFVKINGETRYLWWAVDHEGEALESFVTKRRDRKAALKFLRKTMKRHGPLAQQSSRKFTPAISKAGTGHAPLQADAKFTEIRRRPRLGP